MKLNGWQRIGVVASVVYGIFWIPVLMIIRDGHLSPISPKEMDEVIGVTIVQIVIGWIAVYVSLFAVRWIREGFKDKREK